MIKTEDGKIGTREFVSIILLTIGIKMADTTPSLLYIKGQTGAWMMPIVMLLFLAIPFFLLLTLIKKYEIGFMELLYKITGNFIGTLIGLFILVTLFIGTTLNVRSYTDIVNTMFYQQADLPTLLCLILAASFFIAIRGFQTIGRTAWIIIPIMECSLILLIFAVWYEVDWARLSPLAGAGIKNILKESMTHSGIFIEFILLVMFVPFVRSFKDYRLASLIGIGLSSLKISFFLALYIMVFDYPTTLTLSFHFQQLTRLARLAEVLNHVEMLFFVFWIMASVVHYAIYLYLIAFVFARSLKLEKFEPFILPITGLCFFLALLPENVFQILDYRNMLLLFESGFIFFLPIILWLIDFWKGKKKNAHS